MQRTRVLRASHAFTSSIMSDNEFVTDEEDNPDRDHEILINNNINNNVNNCFINNNENDPPRNLFEEEEQNIFHLANSKDSGIMAYTIPNLTQLRTGIRKPKIDATRFSLKPLMLTMLQTNGQFAGLPSEDPHSHLRSFMEIADSFLIPLVSEDALRLKLFPFSLRDRAKAWYYSLKPDSVFTWNQMVEKFLKKYFPPTRNAKSRNEIFSFKQLDDEAVPDAWDRYKELLRKCPHHGIPFCIQLETFYIGLNVVAKQMLDATAGGAFTACTYNEGIEILEKISNNNGQWSDPRVVPLKKTTGGTEVDAVSALTAQLTKLISNLASSQQVRFDAVALHSAVQSVQCVYCGEGHSFAQCPGNPEQVNFVNKTGPFFQTYNPGWRQHPNFSWNSPALNTPMQKPQGQSNFQNQGQSNFNTQQHQGNQNNQQGHFQNNQSNYQHRPKQNAESSISLETMMKGFMTQTQASIKNLEIQVGQMALEIRKRPVGALPSDTEIPKREGKEHVKSITLRSRKLLPENKQKDSEPLIKAEPEKVPTALNYVPLPLEQSSDISGPKITSKPVDATSIPEQLDISLLLLKDPTSVQKPQDRITVDLSHSGASPAVIPKNPTQVKSLVEPVMQTSAAFEVLEAEDKNTLVPSLEVALDIELKQLPSHLKHAFLRDLRKLPVITSSSLEADQEVTLDVLHGMKYPDESDKRSYFCIHEFSTHEKEVKDVLRKGLKHKWKEKVLANCSNCQIPQD